MNIQSITVIRQVEQGFCWQSEIRFVSFWRFILFALVTGDWNKVHINPFTAWKYKTNLRGLACCGDFVLALTKPGIHKIFHISEDAEIIALGYSSVDLKRPLNLGMGYQYSYTLVRSSVRKGRAYCDWLIEMKTPQGEIIVSAAWKMFYAPVERRKFIKPLIKMFRSQVAEVCHHPVQYICIGILASVILLMCLNYQPPCDSPFAFPLGP
jgi:hypothetical protein